MCTVLALCAAFSAWGGTAYATDGSGAGALSLAPALSGSASGGKVIVVLKDQHANLNLSTQGQQRKAAALSDQAPITASIKAHGGTGVTPLVAPNAVAATVSAAEVAQLRADPAVAEIVPDVSFPDQTPGPANPPAGAAAVPSKSTSAQATTCPFNPAGTSKPLEEPEADADIHASNGTPGAPDEANSIATGKGVIVAIADANQMSGNPNFTRANGTHVIIDAPNYTADDNNAEDYGDVSSVGAQGTVVYQYSKALPYSPVPPGCSFYIEGDAPGASIVDLSEVDTPDPDVAQVIAGVDNAVLVHANVIRWAGEAVALPGSSTGQLLTAAANAAVAAGVTVVSPAGDSGDSGTVEAPADDPQVIAAGAVDNLRLVAMNDGYPSYLSNQMAALSSGGTTPTNKVVDLVAPGWFGESACADNSGGCPPNYPTESFRGTSEASPLIAGAAADVIQAYRDTHQGASPTPAMVKDILTSTATDIAAPADQQGSGLLNVYAAVRAAQQMPGTTGTRGPGDAALVASPSQLDLTGNGGSVSGQSVSLYNASTKPARVTGSYRWLGPERQIGKVVTENISAPPAGTPIPPEGATAASPITFTVPRGLDVMDADMIWPDPTNSNVLQIQLFNPKGALVQESYDDGSPARNQVSDIQHVIVSDPMPGRWTAKILWSGTDEDLALGPMTPGTYTGPMSFKISGQDYLTASAIRPVTIPPHASVAVPLHVSMPAQPGDHPESLQLSAGDGAAISVPIARRTLIPSDGGTFSTLITSSVGRSVGQISTYEINVPAGRSDLDVSLSTPDAAADNGYTFYLVNPSGAVVSTATTPQTVNGEQVTTAELSTADPVAGPWQIDVVLNLTTSGKEFTQTVYGNVSDP